MCSLTNRTSWPAPPRFFEPVADRVDVVGGSFFESVPADCDGYVLKLILHDWQDEEAIEILQVCRAAMASDTRLLVIERILAPPNQGAEGKFSDLNMLVMAGGRERTEDDFAALLADARLRLARTVPTAGSLSVIEAVRSDA